MAEKSQQGMRLAVSPERVTLSVEAANNTLSEADIYNALAEKRVCNGIDGVAVAQAIQDLAAGKVIKNLVIALATNSKPGEPERINQLVPDGQLAVPGDVIASKQPALPGDDGINVLGESVAAKPAATVDLVAGTNTLVRDDQLIATQYGLVRKIEGNLHIVAPLYVTPDKLTAAIDIYPVSALGTAVTFDHITNSLDLHKIVEGVDEDAILAALEDAEQQHEVQRNITVASGIAPISPTTTDVEFYFKIEHQDVKDFLSVSKAKTEPPQGPASHLTLVKEGAVIAKELKGKPGIPGKNIYGELIQPQMQKESGFKAPDCGLNVEKDSETLEYKVTVLQAGYVTFENSKLTVIDPIKISEDKMLATLSVFPPCESEYQKDQLDEPSILKKLESLGVNYGIDKKSLQHIFEQVSETDVPVIDREIAKGNPGKQGDDAFLDYVISVEKAVGKLHEDGSIDFKERGTIINVQGNEAICTKVPPTPGQPAITITGETIPATAGVDVEFKAGEHCCVKDNTFYSTEAGAVFIKDNIVHVTEIFQVDGDVDLSTGNLFQKKGCIEVSGTVQSNFEVKANGHIIVKNNVENGRLIAGGNININGGVVQPETGDGYIHSVGDVFVKFAQNAKIYCYHDIAIGNSSMSSQLHAKGSIVAVKGKGCIIGGTAKAGKSIRAKTIGSPAAATTHVEIEVDPKTRKFIAESIQAAEEGAKTDPEQKKILSKLIKEQRELHEAYREHAEIIVEDVIYPGVTIKILDVTRKITEETRRCKITLSPNNRIKFNKLE